MRSIREYPSSFRVRVPFPFMGLAALVVLGVLFLASCGSRTLTVGVLLELDGSSAELGQACRNGILLAQEISRISGGPPVELVVRDIGSDSAKVLQAAEELWAMGIRVYIGAYTSRQALALKDFMAREGVLFISPAASSTEFSRKADHFFRVITSNDGMAEFMARRMIARNVHHRVIIFQDTDNDPYTRPYAASLAGQIASAGGQTRIVPFSSASAPDFAGLVPADWKQAQAIACLSNGADTGFIAQHLARAGIKAPKWGSAWSMSADAVRSGAQAVEGMEFIIPSDVDSPSPAYRDFAKKYREAYGAAPMFTSALGWESFVLVAGWARDWGPDPEVIGPKLSAGYDFEGLTGKVHLDAWGDVSRTLVPYKIQDGRFVRVEDSGGNSP